MTPNELLLRFGLPCLKYLKIPDTAKADIRQRFFAGDFPSQSELEDIFTVANSCMRAIVDGDYFTVQNIWRFFLMFHNRFVDKHAVDEIRRYWCKTRICEVEQVFGKKARLYYPDHDISYDKTRIFHNDYGIVLAKHDLVVTHHTSIVDKLDR